MVNIRNEVERYMDGIVFAEQVGGALESISEIREQGFEMSFEQDMLLSAIESHLESTHLPSMESMMAEIDESIFGQYCVATEGVVKDAKGMKSGAMAEIRALQTQMRAAKKAKDWTSAAEIADQITTKLNTLKSEIQALPDDTGSFVWTRIINFLCTSVIFCSGMLGVLSGIGKLISSGEYDGTVMREGQDEDGMWMWWEERVDDPDRRMAVRSATSTQAQVSAVSGVLMAGAKNGLETAKILMQAKAAKKAADNPDDVKFLNDHNARLQAVIKDINKLIAHYKKLAGKFRETAAKVAAKAQRKADKQAMKDIKKAEKGGDVAKPEG